MGYEISMILADSAESMNCFGNFIGRTSYGNAFVSWIASSYNNFISNAKQNSSFGNKIVFSLEIL